MRRTRRSLTAATSRFTPLAKDGLTGETRVDSTGPTLCPITNRALGRAIGAGRVLSRAGRKRGGALSTRSTGRWPVDAGILIEEKRVRPLRTIAPHRKLHSDPWRLDFGPADQPNHQALPVILDLLGQLVRIFVVDQVRRRLPARGITPRNLPQSIFVVSTHPQYCLIQAAMNTRRHLRCQPFSLS